MFMFKKSLLVFTSLFLISCAGSSNEKSDELSQLFESSTSKESSQNSEVLESLSSELQVFSSEEHEISSSNLETSSSEVESAIDSSKEIESACETHSSDEIFEEYSTENISSESLIVETSEEEFLSSEEELTSEEILPSSEEESILSEQISETESILSSNEDISGTSESEIKISEESSEELIESSEQTWSSSLDTSSEQQEVNVKSIKKECLALTLPENSAGLIETDVERTITGRIFAVYDSIATGKDYATSLRYKAMFSDGTDYMFLSINEAFYQKVKDYTYASNTTYEVTGTLEMYRGTPMLKISSYTFLNKVLDIDISLFGFESTISEVKEEISSSRVSSKGNAYLSIHNIKMKYLAKMDNAVLLFTDGNNFIEVHGSNKVGNNFTIGSSYIVTGSAGLYIYKPSFEFLQCQIIDEEIVTPSPLNEIKASDFYSYTYKNDTEKHYVSYEHSFYDSYSFKGYVTSYFKSGNEYLVLSDSYRSKSFDTYTQALNAKAVFLKNDTETALYYESDYSHSKLLPYLNSQEQIEITIVSYLFNTQKYFQVYGLLD